MSFRSRLLPLLALSIIAGATAAHAQYGIYAMGSGAFLGSGATAPEPVLDRPVPNNGFSAYGFTVGLYDEFAHLGPVRLGGDVRYFQDSSSNDNGYGNKLHGVTSGLRLAVHVPVIPFRPYVQAEIGGIGTNYGLQRDDSGSFAYQVQGGLDFTVLPHIDLRAEYSGGQGGNYLGQRQSLQQAGVGAVVRF